VRFAECLKKLHGLRCDAMRLRFRKKPVIEGTAIHRPPERREFATTQVNREGESMAKED
jgi:hypothetical protein